MHDDVVDAGTAYLCVPPPAASLSLFVLMCAVVS